MSFEGYYQALCERGHEMGCDCYEGDPEKNTCSCGAPVAWWNLVDTTNGSFEQRQGKRIRVDTFIKLRIKTPEKFCLCPTCGVSHIAEEATFYIPKERGHTS